MGIPGFNKWFKKENESCYVKLDSVTVDHLYIDANSIIHSALRQADSWEKFHKRLHSWLNNIMETSSPRKSVMLAVDGPAPLAKLLMQRERRKKSGRVGEGAERVDALSSNAITPGTHFMADVTLSLYCWVATKLSQRRFSHVHFELSDATVPGEGEVKILGRLARHWYPTLGPQDTHVIVGDDADLVLMALVQHTPHLYVVNTSVAPERRLAPNMPVFSVDRLHEAWRRSMVPPAAMPTGEEERAVLLGLKMDLALLSVICNGNDYLPPVRGISMDPESGGNGVWPYYKRMRQKGGSGQRPIVSLDDSGSPVLDLQLLAHVVQACCRYRGGDSDFDGLLEVKGDCDADNYLRGCVWMMEMYHKGCCPDYRWHYDGVPPSASRLLDACKARAGGLLAHAHFPLPAENQQPLLPVASAVALLPVSCKHMLPLAVRPLMEAAAGASPLTDIFAECAECESLRRQGVAASQEMNGARMRCDAISANARGAALAEDGELQAELGAKLQAAQAEWEAAKERFNAVQGARRAHLRAAHPYRPFPVERIAAAVAAVPLQAYTPAERPLTRLGQPVVLRQQQARGRPPLPLMPSPFSGDKQLSRPPLIQRDLVVEYDSTAAGGTAVRQYSSAAVQCADGSVVRQSSAVVAVQLAADDGWAVTAALQYLSAPAGSEAAAARGAPQPQHQGFRRQEQQQQQQQQRYQQQPVQAPGSWVQQQQHWQGPLPLQQQQYQPQHQPSWSPVPAYAQQQQPEPSRPASGGSRPEKQQRNGHHHQQQQQHYQQQHPYQQQQAAWQAPRPQPPEQRWQHQRPPPPPPPSSLLLSAAAAAAAGGGQGGASGFRAVKRPPSAGPFPLGM